MDFRGLCTLQLYVEYGMCMYVPEAKAQNFHQRLKGACEPNND